ncbi:staphylococcal nuclease domain-containing protein 1 [Arapaima gigas]
MVYVLLCDHTPMFSTRLPREANNKDKRFCPLYDIPYMSEVREFLWKKFIGKKYGSKVNVTVDYIHTASSITHVGQGSIQVYPEHICAIYRMDDDNQCSSYYEELLATKVSLGPSKTAKECTVRRKCPFTKWLISLGSTHQETCLVTFLLAGIECPLGVREHATEGHGRPCFSQRSSYFIKRWQLIKRGIKGRRSHEGKPVSGNGAARQGSPIKSNYFFGVRGRHRMQMDQHVETLRYGIYRSDLCRRLIVC